MRCSNIFTSKQEAIHLMLRCSFAGIPWCNATLHQEDLLAGKTGGDKCHQEGISPHPSSTLNSAKLSAIVDTRSFFLSSETLSREAGDPASFTAACFPFTHSRRTRMSKGGMQQANNNNLLYSFCCCMAGHKKYDTNCTKSKSNKRTFIALLLTFRKR